MRIRTALMSLAAVATATLTVPTASASAQAPPSLDCDNYYNGGTLEMTCYLGGIERGYVHLEVDAPDSAAMWIRDKAKDEKGVTFYVRRTSDNLLLKKVRTASGGLETHYFPIKDGTNYYALMCLDGQICGQRAYGKA